MIRTLLVVMLVAGLSCWIHHLAMIRGDYAALSHAAHMAQPTEWVFTTDGWEPTAVLVSQSASSPCLHPMSIAALQLGGSLLVLLAFPAKLSRPDSK